MANHTSFLIMVLRYQKSDKKNPANYKRTTRRHADAETKARNSEETSGNTRHALL